MKTDSGADYSIKAREYSRSNARAASVELATASLSSIASISPTHISSKQGATGAQK